MGKFTDALKGKKNISPEQERISQLPIGEVYNEAEVFIASGEKSAEKASAYARRIGGKERSYEHSQSDTDRLLEECNKLTMTSFLAAQRRKSKARFEGNCV